MEMMELRDYIRLVRKGWVLIVALLLMGVAAGAALSILSAPKYEASTQLFVSVQSSDSATASDLVQGSSAAQLKVKSYVDVVTSSRVLAPVIDKLSLKETPADLATRVSAESPINTVLMNITVADTAPKRAARIANAIGSSFSDVVVNQLESPDDDGPSLVKIETIEPASAPDQPSSPRTALNIALGLLVGLVVGVGTAILRSTLDTRIHGPHDLEHLTQAPVLGGIAFDPEAQQRPLIVSSDPRSPRAEAFRSLRTNLQFLNLDTTHRCFVVTSSLPGEGKTTTTSNLAIALSETGASVVVVDGDLRLPRLAETMGLEGVTGLTDLLIGRAVLEDVLQPWGRGSLYVLPAGRIPPNPSELLGSRAMAGLIDSLTQTFDYVLIDAPPLLPVTDAAVISKYTGGAIVVAAAGRTKKNEFSGAIRNLANIGSTMLGVVLTMTATKGPDAYGYGAYGEYYGHVGDKMEPSIVPSSGSKRPSKLRTR